MNALHRDVSNLLDTIARLKRQHAAGITPPFGELEALFEDAANVQRDLTAVACGLTPPEVEQPQRGRLTLERVEGAPVRMTLSVGRTARAVLESLPRAAGGSR